jgi:hypothetical protein
MCFDRSVLTDHGCQYVPTGCLQTDCRHCADNMSEDRQHCAGSCASPAVDTHHSTELLCHSRQQSAGSPLSPRPRTYTQLGTAARVSCLRSGLATCARSCGLWAQLHMPRLHRAARHTQGKHRRCYCRGTVAYLKQGLLMRLHAGYLWPTLTVWL